MPLPETDPDVLEIKSGGGCVSLFGVPFLLVGLGVVAGTVYSAAEGDFEGPPLFFGIPFGLIFATVGGAFVFGRSGLRIDRKSGTLVKWWGLLRPMRAKNHALAKVDSVGLYREVRRSDKSTQIVYPVRLAMSSGSKIDVSAGNARLKARTEAESLAKFIRVPMDDFSEGEPTRRDFRDLDASLKDRFRQGRMNAEIPEVPKAMKTRVQFDGARLEVNVPPLGFQPGPALVGAGMLAFAAVTLFTFFIPMLGEAGGSVFFQVVIMAFASLFTLMPASIGLGLFAKMLLVRERIVADAGGVQRVSGWLIQRQSTLAADEIEDIRLAPVNLLSVGDRPMVGSRAAIMLEADRKSLRFGGSLEPEEAAYLMALIRSVLVS